MKKDLVADPVSTTSELSGGSPGSILRRCREFHGISLEEASETTKIGISHLKALEDDQIREFANQAYLKGFLRIYATYLGLNSDDVARMYDKLFGVKGDKPESVRSPQASVRPSRRKIPLKKMVFPVILFVVILVTATFFKRPSAPPNRQPQPLAVSAPQAQNAAVQHVQSSVRNRSVEQADTAPPKTEIHSAEPSNTENSPTPNQPVDAAKGFILKIRVTQNGTLTATVDGSGAQQYDLTAGDVIEWKAEKKVTLDLSNAGGVDVELNGMPYKSLGPPGKPAYVELDADGIKQ